MLEFKGALVRLCEPYIAPVDRDYLGVLR